MYPRLLHIYGPVWIYSYGIMIALGFIFYLILTINHPRRIKYLSIESFLNTVFIGFLGALIGGRLLFVVTHLELFKDNAFEILFPWVGGFTLLGSLIGVTTLVPLYLCWKKIPILPILDLSSIYAPYLQFFARIGCFLAGCCYGLPAHGISWAVTFTDPAGSAPLNIPLHPTQLYMSLGSLITFYIMFHLGYTKKTKPGQLIFTYLTLENIARFVVDFWRGDREHLTNMGSFLGKTLTLSTSQLHSLIFLGVSLGALLAVSFLNTSPKKAS